MKAVGIIAEYNPFHNGHAYQIRRAKEITGADCAVAVMSGDFVQRGEPAVLDKYTRTRMALLGGADAVFELPAVYATAASRDFAAAGCAALEAAGCAYLCFGTDGGTPEELRRAAEALADEPDPFREVLREHLKNGETYAAAEAAALEACGAALPACGPNSRLAVEYLRAVRVFGLSLRPAAVRRIGQDYASGELSVNRDGSEDGAPGGTVFPSALSLRNEMKKNGEKTDYSPYIPKEALSVFREACRQKRFLFPEDFADLLNYAILLCPHPERAAGFTPELAARLLAAGPGPRTPEQWTALLKTRNLTQTRVSRALTHLLLGITEEDAGKPGGAGPWRPVPYLRLLGFRREASAFLAGLRGNCPVPVINKVADAAAKLDSRAARCFSADLRAAELYRQVLYRKSGVLIPDEYRAGVVIV